MIDREVGELRRRLRPGRTGITEVLGRYVNCKGEIIAGFTQSVTALHEDEQEKYLDLLRKSLGGSVGRTLNDISFSTAQVENSEEHRLLMRLRESRLKDEEAVDALCGKIASSLRFEDDNYLILLAAETYDVPYRSKDGERQDDAGDVQFPYFLCAVCPVKESKSVLRYESSDRVFRTRGTEWAVSLPQVGFLFPAFDDRAANIYGALYYVRDNNASYDEFVQTVFRVKPLPAVNAQKEKFGGVLTQSLEEECTAQVVQTVHSRLRGMVQIHKEEHIPEPLRLSAEEADALVEDCGISEQRKAAFRVNYETAFGLDSEIPPRNLMDSGKLEYRLPDVIIKVNPEYENLIETKVIDGVGYLMIRADSGVEINGVAVHIEGENKQ